MEGEQKLDLNTLTEPLVSAIPHASTFLWALFTLIALYTVVHAIVFVYHWHKYNIAPGPFLRRTYIVYFSGIFVFLILLLISVFAITN